MAIYVGLDSNALELYHYGRVGMKWGKHIFGDEIKGAVRRAASRARTASVLASVGTTSGAKKAYSGAKRAYSSLAKAASKSSLAKAVNKTSVGKRINQARVSAAMAKMLNNAKTPDEKAIRGEWSFRNRKNHGTYAEYFSLMKRLGIV